MEIGEVLRQCGYQAWEAANTAEALSMLEHAADHFIGLITEINMPGVRNGVVLANHVRFMWPHISIVVASAAREPMEGELPPHGHFCPSLFHRASSSRRCSLRAEQAGELGCSDHPNQS
jgi:CheY-like chemotaxis protein